MRAQRPGRRRRAALLLAAALLAALVGCRPPVRGSGLNVLLITFETTRADHLSGYGYERETTPNLDALAGQGTLFERALSVSPRTNPSLASLMTSRYPHEHGVRNLLLPLEPDNHTLAELLRDAGYTTGAVQTHPRLVASSGFEQGFATYEDDYRRHPLAPQACAVATRWIERQAQGDRPWFMWLHLMDPHWTYDPPPPWRSVFAPDDPRPARLYRDLVERRIEIGSVVFENTMAPDEVAAFVNLYDAEIRYTDEAVGQLLWHLERIGVRDRTLIVISADHGESLGEHGYFFEHGDFGTEPEIHVPLIIAGPDELPRGKRVPQTVSSVDVAPTILDLLGLSSEGRFRGASLMPLVEDGDHAEDRECFGETGKRFHEQNVRREVEGAAGKWRWLRQGRFKLTHAPRASGTVERRLYDLVADPGETRDVAEAHPEVLASFRERLDAWIAEDPGDLRDYHISAETEEILRSLGYVN